MNTVAPTVTPGEVGVSSDRLARLSDVMQAYVDDGKLAGIVTLLARRGKVFHFEKFGLRDIDSGRPMELDTIVRFYSMTKPITSAAVMSLHEEGHFQLDEPVSGFIPELSDLKVYAGMGETGMRLVDQERPITIRHLLTHTAGLSNGVFEDSPVEDMYRKAFPRPYDTDLEGWVARLGELPLVYQPGAGWRYSVATDVLGRLVEVVSGQTFDRFLRERIFEPLGMPDTGFHVPEESLDRFATVYGPSDNGGIAALDSPAVMQFTRPVQMFSGGGGLVSTAADYFRFCQMMLNGGELDGTRVLGRKTIELMTANHLPPELIPFRISEQSESVSFTAGCGFGLGFKVVIDVAQTGIPGSVGSYAWVGAASTVFWIDPVEDLIAIFLAQFMPTGTYPVWRQFQVLTYQAMAE